MIHHTPLALALALGAALLPAAPARAANADSSNEGVSPAFERRAAEAVIWGIPLVSTDAMRDAYFRDAGAKYNDILYWSRPSDWQNQTTTPNSTSHYVYANVNLRDGPVVFDMPPSGKLSVYGNLQDGWQIPVEDFGHAGIDEGKGGRFLLTPPGYKVPVPPGMRQLAMSTYNGYFLLRLTPVSSDPREAAEANAMAKQVRLYPLSTAAAPKPQRYIDMSDRLFDAIVRMDDSFFDRLAKMLAEEPAERRDMVMRGMMRTLGIEPGKAFAPTPRQRQALAKAAAQVRGDLMIEGQVSRTPWWPNEIWSTTGELLPLAKGGFTFELNDALRIDERAWFYFKAFASPKRLGTATFYVTQSKDPSGAWLTGERDYVLHVPANVPAKQFWSVDVYDLETSGFLRNAPVVGIDSNERSLTTNKDGSVDIRFSASAPERGKGNWIALTPGKRWFAMFRFYGPQPALFDKNWVLPSIRELPAPPK
jgi:hypothetical protein